MCPGRTSGVHFIGLPREASRKLPPKTEGPRRQRVGTGWEQPSPPLPLQSLCEQLLLRVLEMQQEKV